MPLARLQPGSYTLATIAATGERFADFAPYVASVNNRGIVAFQATLSTGGSGVYLGAGGPLTTIVESVADGIRGAVSHPDLNENGAVCFYAELVPEGRGVMLVRNGEMTTLDVSCGPLGPTINESGLMAFRRDGAPGESAIMTGGPGRATTIARAPGQFTGFHGLPVVKAGGAVVFRADLAPRGQGIFVGDGRRITPVVRAGEQFGDLGPFPAMNESETVVFCATLRAGGCGLFAAPVDGGREANIEPVLDSRGRFESFRGVLIDRTGRTVFYGTPRGGRLGVYSGPDPETDRLLGVGSPLFGSAVAEFALNPVSINDAGQLAIRVKLEDRRQFILRADPD